MIGKKFTRLTVLSKSEIKKENLISWVCKCDCGNELIVAGSRLRSGRVKSCGCLQREKARASDFPVIDRNITGRRILIPKLGFIKWLEKQSMIEKQ